MPIARETKTIEHPRLRILWPKEFKQALDDAHTITHWIFISDDRARPITYGHEYIAIHKDGHAVKGFQLHKEFDK